MARGMNKLSMRMATKRVVAVNDFLEQSPPDISDANVKRNLAYRATFSSLVGYVYHADNSYIGYFWRWLKSKFNYGLSRAKMHLAYRYAKDYARVHCGLNNYSSPKSITGSSTDDLQRMLEQLRSDHASLVYTSLNKRSRFRKLLDNLFAVQKGFAALDDSQQGGQRGQYERVMLEAWTALHAYVRKIGGRMLAVIVGAEHKPDPSSQVVNDALIETATTDLLVGFFKERLRSQPGFLLERVKDVGDINYSVGAMIEARDANFQVAQRQVQKHFGLLLPYLVKPGEDKVDGQGVAADLIRQMVESIPATVTI